MILGIDFSSYYEEEACGARYFADGKEVDPLDLCRAEGVTLSRIRVWNRPFDDDGKPYLGGTCDENRAVELAKLSKKYGYEILMDFHYSDFWVDPNKQTMPKDWVGLSEDELVKAVREYTYKVLAHIKSEGVDVAYVQIGNEITHGMLWPVGKLDYSTKPASKYDVLCRLLSAGIEGAKAVYPNIKIVIHLEQSYAQDVYREYFDHLVKYGVQFDIIGMSYYPFWHGDFGPLFENVDMCKARYGKQIMIAEVGYAWTIEDYLPDADDSHMVIGNGANGTARTPYPYTKEGQKQFVEALVRTAKEHDLFAICYWEPFWIPMGGKICWTSKEGQKYIHEEAKSIRNEWANQCLFDYDGNALPALFAFTVKE
ncbi:MAG: arabinogalactan endo-1,4-beta-galactosidase [Bacilli bacterium]|nr:arabinogalactan endo-1,4-beta-galactosidase [Bacilli bacterium]